MDALALTFHFGPYATYIQNMAHSMELDLFYLVGHVPFRCGRWEQLFSAYWIFAAD